MCVFRILVISKVRCPCLIDVRKSLTLVIFSPLRKVTRYPEKMKMQTQGLGLFLKLCVKASWMMLTGCIFTVVYQESTVGLLSWPVICLCRAQRCVQASVKEKSHTVEPEHRIHLFSGRRPTLVVACCSPSKGIRRKTPERSTTSSHWDTC